MKETDECSIFKKIVSEHPEPGTYTCSKEGCFETIPIDCVEKAAGSTCASGWLCSKHITEGE